MFVFQTMDCVQTSMAGIDREANILVRLVWMILGFGVIVAIKMLSIVICTAACRYVHHPKNPFRWMRWVFHAEMAVVIGTGLAVYVWNCMQLN